MRKTAVFNVNEVFVISFSFAILFSVITGFVVYGYLTSSSAKNNSNVDDIVSTYNKVINNYYEDIDKEGLKDAAISGMMNFLDEKYSVVLDSTSSNSLYDKLDGYYKGIGIEIKKNGDNKFEIINVLKNSPAKTAGLKVDDIIETINGVVLQSDFTNNDILSMFDKSEKVKFEIRRGNKILLFEIKIGNIYIPVTKTKVYKSNKYAIGYIKLSNFSSSSYEQFKDSLEDVEKEKIDSLIIDLRSNTGGYLNSADKIASLFLKKDKRIYALKNKEKLEYYVDKTEEHRNYPIVVLVNKNTASASEILTFALKESYGAFVIGNKTYGKGKVQQFNTLSNMTTIKYTTALWYSPNGNSCDEVGIEPGITVNLKALSSGKYNYDSDSQVEKSIEFLINYINSKKNY